MTASVYAVATMDTKGRELSFLAEMLRGAGVPVVTVDVGTMNEPEGKPDVGRSIIASHLPDQSKRSSVLNQTDRGQAIGAMSQALEQYLLAEWKSGRVAGVIGLGGSGGTALITQAMRALPIGLPKLMVSTVASGNTAP